MPTRVAGIQPGYLPWLGYFDQMRQVDAFIIADEMEFSSSGWTHRNRVRGPAGAHWLHLPIRRDRDAAPTAPAAATARTGDQRADAGRPPHDRRICDVPLDAGVPWARRHLTTLRHFYRRSPFAKDVLAALDAALDRSARRMVEASIPSIRFLATHLRIDTPLVVSSEHALERRYREEFPDRPGPTERIIAFMKVLGAHELLEGASGRAYLDVALCARHGIRVEFHDYRHPRYRQLHEPFVSHLSALDLLLCAGPEAAPRVLRSVP